MGESLFQADPARPRPLVSVCIGTYNRARYVQETLDSVFAQTYRPLEVVVVDDASTDGTPELVERLYGDRVRLIRRATNSGMCPITRNQAAQAATGRYLAFLDSDDGWYPTKIEKQVALLEAHPVYPLCHTYAHLIDEESQVFGTRHEGRMPPTGDCFAALLRHCWITISSILVRRELFDEIGWFTEDPRYGIWGEDHEFFLRVARRHPVALVEEPLARYRRARQNISAGNWRQTPESVPFHEMVLNRPDLWEGRASRRAVVEAFGDVCLENARHWRARGRPERAAWFALRALRHDPARAAVWGDLARSSVRMIVKGKRE
jgi:glycosyltransferase involved in cell wall biosynthesis